MFDHDLKHDRLIAKPTEPKNLARLQDILRTTYETSKNAQDHLCFETVTNSQISTVNNLTIVQIGNEFQGIVMCASCMRKATMYLRDLANVFDDLINECEKHKT